MTKGVQKNGLPRTPTGIRTLAARIWQKTGYQSPKAQSEDFADDFDNLILTLKVLNFLQKNPARLIKIPAEKNFQ